MGKLQINGDLLLAGNLMMSTSNVSAYSVISVKPDSNGYGQNLIIGAGGNTVIGGGESASAFFTASGIQDEENLYLTADDSIHVYTNCDSIANRKLVMSMGADGNITTTGTIITPGNDSVVIKPAKHNYDQIGAADCKFWKIHATTFYGNLSGNADSGTTFYGSITGNANYATSAGSASSATYAGYLPSYTEYSSASSLDGFITDGVLRWAKVNSAALAFGNDGSVISVGWGGGYGSQVWLDDGSGPAKMAVRNRSGGSSWNGWRHCIMSCSETYYGGSLPSSGNVGDVFFKT